MPVPVTTTRVETDFSLGWAQANPELLGKTILKLLEEHPVEEWDLTFKRAIHPGMAYTISAKRKKA